MLKHPGFHRWVVNRRLSRMSRALDRLLQGQGATFRCTGSGITVLHRDKEILFPQGKLASLLHVLRDLDWFEGRLVFEEQGGRYFSDCREGTRRYRLPWNQSTILLPGIPESVDFVAGYILQGQPAEGSTAFDLGAYCGETSLALAKMVGPRGRVFAFEPDAENRRWLELNIRESGFTNITVIDRGLWKESTTLRFTSHHGIDAAISVPGSPEAGTYEIKTIGFQEACDLVGTVPEFVKMDIEGAEVEVLEAAAEFIACHQIDFAIASYHLRNGRPTSELIEPLLRKAGYLVQTGFATHLTTWARKPHRLADAATVPVIP